MHRLRARARAAARGRRRRGSSLCLAVRRGGCRMAGTPFPRHLERARPEATIGFARGLLRLHVGADGRVRSGARFRYGNAGAQHVSRDVRVAGGRATDEALARLLAQGPACEPGIERRGDQPGRRHRPAWPRLAAEAGPSALGRRCLLRRADRPRPSRYRGTEGHRSPPRAMASTEPGLRSVDARVRFGRLRIRRSAAHRGEERGGHRPCQASASSRAPRSSLWKTLAMMSVV